MIYDIWYMIYDNNNIYIYELKSKSPGRCFLGRFWVGTNVEKNDMILFLFIFSKNPWIEVANTWNRTINYLKWFEGNVCRTLLPTSPWDLGASITEATLEVQTHHRFLRSQGVRGRNVGHEKSCFWIGSGSFIPTLPNEFQVGDGWGIMMIRLEGTLVKSWLFDGYEKNSRSG